MEFGLPRYPVDFLRLTVVFEPLKRRSAVSDRLIIDIVRENPFGVAFDNRMKRKTNVRTL